MERKIYIKSITFLLLFLIISCHSVAKAEKKNVILDELLTEVQKTLIRVRDSSTPLRMGRILCAWGCLIFRSERMP